MRHTPNSCLKFNEWANKSDCGKIIDKGKNFCHVPASVWEMEQSEVCNLCLKHNLRFRSICRRCNYSVVSSERWISGCRLCSMCLNDEIRAQSKLTLMV